MDYIRYANQGATRSLPLSPELANALSYLQDIGVTAEVFSGGQGASGSGAPRTGSVRHDHGNAADVFFYKDGRKLDWANPNALPVFQDIVARGKAAGLTGFGAGPGYMRPGSMHIGFGNPAVWGAGGKGANAPDWLRAAYSGAARVSASGPQRQTGGRQMADPMALSTKRGQGILPGPVAPQQEQERRRGLFSPDVRDRLILALEGMTLNPNQALMQQAAAGLEERRDTRKTQKAVNATAAWLASIGRDDLAQALQSGAIDGKTAASIAYREPKPARTQVVGDRVIDLDTGKVIYEPDAASKPALDKDQLSALNTLRDDVRTELSSFNIVKQGYNNIMTFYDNPGATSDYALAVAFAKVLDPGSVAREGEVAAVQNAGARVPALGQALKNAITGEGSLTPQVRQEIAQLAVEIYGERAQAAQQTLESYGALADQAGVPKEFLYSGQIPEPRKVVPVVAPPAPAGADPATWADVWAEMTEEERRAFLEAGK